jgi:serpin B
MLSKYSKIGKIVFFIIFIAIFVILFSVTNNNNEDTPPKADDANATEEGIEKIVNANNKFTFDIYSKLNETNEGNIFFSPYSISTALSMTYEGANGITASEMENTLYIPSDDQIRRPAIASIYNELNKNDIQYKLNTANAIWPQKEYPILQEYKNVVEQYYGGKATNLDFQNNLEESRNIINSWVENKTNDKIKNLFEEGSLSPTTRLVLTNAIYFKGDWAKQFDKKNTKEEIFTINEGNTTKVQMMSQTDNEAEFKYSETDKLQVLEIPYKDEELSMTIFLPKESDMDYLEENLDQEKIKEWKNDLRKQRVNVYMPKFTFDTKYNLNETLKQLGMPSAFSGSADFSKITGGKDLFISLVVHQAFIDVNEEGTEAAAATGVVMLESAIISTETPVFRADHPFIFVIQDSENQNILFMGKVTNPSE